MSELAEREVKETSVTWRDCCAQVCLPAASSNVAVGLEQDVCSASCPDNQCRFICGDNSRYMVACLRAGECAYLTREWTVR